MATFKITADKSVYAPLGNAFLGDSLGPDTLIVDPGAFLIATDTAFAAAELQNTGLWTVTVNGLVYSDDYYAIRCLGPANVSIGTEGIVAGHDGILANDAATIKNAGVISATTNGIRFAGTATHTVINSGSLAGASDAILDIAGLSIEKVTNSGLIDGLITLGGNNDTLTNTASGHIKSVVDMGEGNNTLSNSGTIDGRIQGGGGTNILTNSGFLGSYVDLSNGGGSNGNIKVTNSGVIWGHSLYCGIGNDTVVNSGTVGIEPGGLVDLFDGNDTLTNSGKILNELDAGKGNDVVVNSGIIGTVDTPTEIDLGAGDDKFVNSGTLYGSFLGGIGNDTFTNFIGLKSGTVSGDPIDLGEGDDKFFGGNKPETVIDSEGTDIVKLGGGNDTFIAPGANNVFIIDDVVDGGAGKDTYDASTGTQDFRINLDSIGHDVAPFGAVGVEFISANTASQPLLGQVDKVFNIENAKGGSGTDVIYGNAAANVLEGGGGAVDNLFGFGGNDTLIGGPGFDLLVGGAGRDILTGGTEQDYFGYTSIKDSGVTKATRDVITDFGGSDQIYLAFLDADSTQAGLQHFTHFSLADPGNLFHGLAGELRSYWSANGEIVEADVNGDKKADFSIELIDPSHAIDLSGAFLLV